MADSRTARLSFLGKYRGSNFAKSTVHQRYQRFYRLMLIRAIRCDFHAFSLAYAHGEHDNDGFCIPDKSIISGTANTDFGLKPFGFGDKFRSRPGMETGGVPDDDAFAVHDCLPPQNVIN